MVEDSGENRTAPQISSIQLRNTLFFYSLLSLSLSDIFFVREELTGTHSLGAVLLFEG